MNSRDADEKKKKKRKEKKRKENKGIRERLGLNPTHNPQRRNIGDFSAILNAINERQG